MMLLWFCLIDFNGRSTCPSFRSVKDGKVNRCHPYPVQHHLGELIATRWAFISIYPPEVSFQTLEEPTFQTVIPYMRGHSCACPGAKWTGMCRLSRSWRTGLWLPSPTLPCLHSPFLPTHPDLSQHHHPRLSPGVQLASDEWIDTLTSAREVCTQLCICACWKSDGKALGGEGWVISDVNSWSQ